MTRAAVLAAALALAVPAAACSGKAPPPSQPEVPATVTPDADPVSGLEPGPGGEDEAPEEERIAAIQKAMNDLAPVANQCWAVGAADDFHLAGDLRFLIVVGPKAGPGAQVTATADSAGDAALTACMVTVLEAYAWAPPLHGEGVELPFHFTAPAMQNVIDRRFVPHKAQAGVDVAVLLDERNTGNPALSLAEVTIAAGGHSGPRELERTELWSFRTAATVASAGGKAVTLGPDDVMVAPKGARLMIEAGAAPVTAVVALSPGGREGAARAGALPGRTTTMDVTARPVQPVFVLAARARTYPRASGATQIFVEAPAGGAVSLGLLSINAGASVPKHVHAKETEVLYVRSGAGTLTVGGVDVPVTEHSVIQLPAGVEHAFVATAATSALQLYTPAGPEQRFKTMK